jgi:hypothetical protein
MYMLDPDKGRRRRAIARDKVRSVLAQAEAFAGKAARDLSHRFDGVRAEVARPFRGDGTPDDLQLIERVRSRLGRVVSHPHAIHVGAYLGRVTVSGPILAREVAPLIEAVRAVPGVDAVDDHLVAFDSAGSVSSLQGTPARAMRQAEWSRRNWTPSLRAAAMCAGAALALAGVRSRTIAGLAFAGLGLALGARAATNSPVLDRLDSRRLRRRNGAHEALAEKQA